MKTLTASYQYQEVKIHFGENFINTKWELLDKNCKYLVITDQNLNKLYSPLLSSIPGLVGIIPIVPGEYSKSLDTYRMIITILQEYQLTKNDVIIGFGGGVITDICGFVAGTYRRGISFINIPTSLIGMVDASIGGKCGLNVNSLKNQIGLIYHPTKILIDTAFLNTLDERQLVSGIAEIIKIAVTKDEKMFNELYHLSKDYQNDLSSLNNLIYRAIMHKIKITEKDEFDTNKRHILNFGHTIGHLIETKTDFQLTHGEAVAMGMIAEITNPKVEQILTLLLKKFNLLNHEIEKLDYLALINYDKKVSNGKILLLSIDSIGHSKLKQYRLEDLKNEQFWKEY